MGARAQFREDPSDRAAETSAFTYVPGAASALSETEYPKSFALFRDFLLHVFDILCFEIRHRLFIASVVELLACDNFCFERQFRPGFSQSFARHCFRRSIDLENDAPRPDIDYVADNVSFAASHADFRRLLRHGTVGKYAHPDFCALSARARESAPRSFKVIRCDACRRYGLKAERAEADRNATRFERVHVATVSSASLPLPELRFFWSQHTPVLFFRLLLIGEYFAAVYPYLDTYLPVREECFLAREIDVGAQSLKRHAAFLYFLRARHFSAAQASCDGNAHAFHVAVRHCFLSCLLQNTPKCLPFFEAFSDHVRDDRCLRFRGADFLDVEAYCAVRSAGNFAQHFLYFFGELCASLSAAADDKTGTRRLYENAYVLLAPLYLHGSDVVAAQALFQKAAYRGIHHDVLAIFPRSFREPARFPITDDAEAMCVWMYCVCHIDMFYF